MREHDDGKATLYHFTNLAAWERIRATGMIQVTDPQLNPTPEGPSGVVTLKDGTFSLVRMDAGRVVHPVGDPFSEHLTLGEVLPAHHDLGPLVVHLTEEPRLLVHF